MKLSQKNPSVGKAVGRLRPKLAAWLEDCRRLRDRQVRSMVGADFSSLLGTAMVIAVLPFAVTSIGGSGGDIAWALAVQGVAIVPGLFVGGALGDRHDRRVLMIMADLARFGSQAAIAVLLLTGVAELWELLATQLVNGFASGVFMPASRAIVPDVVDGKVIQVANGLKQMGRAVAGTLGPALGALVCALAEPGIAFLVDAASFAASAFFLSALQTKRHVRESSERLRAELAAGFKEFLSINWLRVVTVQFAVINAFVLAPFFVFGPLVAEESLGGSSAWAFILISVAVGEIAGGAIGVSWQPPRPMLAATMIFLAWGLMLVALALSSPLPVIGVAALVAGASQAIFEVLFETTMQTEIKDPLKRAKIASFDELGGLAVVPLGFVLGGWMADTIGSGAGLLVGCVVLLGACLAALATTGVRQLRARPEEKTHAVVVAPATASVR